MTQKDEALQILKDYNAWRRDKGDTENLVMPDPKKIGEAIDVAITVLSEPEREWRGLSVDDITKLIEQLCGSGKAVNWDVNFAKAIEAKLKELNHD